MLKFIFLFLLFSGCSSLKKDNESHDPIREPLKGVKERVPTYRALGRTTLDSKGLYHHNGRIGDSALFSCLSYAAGIMPLDPSVFFTKEGKPLRHPNISPADSKTPISRDMIEGLLWCLVKLKQTDKEKAQTLIKKMIDYGRKNAVGTAWNFCDKSDIENYGIKEADLVGRCVMTPATMKNVHRTATYLGVKCDEGCKVSMQVGVNLPINPKGFEGHLQVLATIRNGIVEGGINDNSLKQLKNFVDREKNNALYRAAYHRFKDGDQFETWALLDNPLLFPLDKPATNNDYCTDYLYQRDEIVTKDMMPDKDGCLSWIETESQETVSECGFTPGKKVTKEQYNPDWLPCPEKDAKYKTMTDWLFAYAVAMAEI